jgi:hypothetical protein
MGETAHIFLDRLTYLQNRLDGNGRYSHPQPLIINHTSQVWRITAVSNTAA